MIFKRFSRREITILILCVTVVGFYVGYNFIFKPLKDKGITLSNDIDANQRRLEKNLRMIEQSGSVGKQHAQYAEQLKQKLTEEAQMAAVLSEIEFVAKQIELSIDNMKPNRVRKVDFYNEFSVSLILNGPLESVIHFLYMIENVPHLFSVESMRLEKRSPRQSDIRCQLILSRMFIL